MAIEKGLYAAPQSIDDELPDDEALPEAELEIEIVNPDMVTLDDGSVEITLVPGSGPSDMSFDGNLAEEMEDTERTTLSEELIGLIDADMDSRKEWADTFVKGLDVLGSSMKNVRTLGRELAAYTPRSWLRLLSGSRRKP